MLVLLCVHMHMCFLISEWPEEGVSLRRLPITGSENWTWIFSEKNKQTVLTAKPLLNISVNKFYFILFIC